VGLWIEMHWTLPGSGVSEPLPPAPSTTGTPQVPECWPGLHYVAADWKVSVESGQPKKILPSEITQYCAAWPDHLAVKFTVSKHHLCVQSFKLDFGFIIFF